MDPSTGMFRAEIGRLHEAQAGRLEAVAWRILRDPEEAREAVQDALLSACAGIAGFQGGSRLSTWLHRIVVNAALMRLRRSRRVSFVGYEDGWLHEASPAPLSEPEGAVQTRERLRVVHEGVRRLSESYRRVLWMRDVEGLDTEETARALGVTANTVKIRLHRARQSLRRLVASAAD